MKDGVVYFENMLDPQELKQFERVVQLIVKNEIDRSVQESETRMKTETKQLIAESETRMKAEMKYLIVESETRMKTETKQLGNDIGDMIDRVLLTQIGEKADKKEVRQLSEIVAGHDKVIKTVKAGFAN